MAGPRTGSPEFLAETNNPGLDQRVCIAFIIIDTVFLAVFYMSWYINKKTMGLPMLVLNTLCYIFCMGSAATGILMVHIGGAGYHTAAVPITTYQNWLKLSKVLEFTYTPAVMFAKLAALYLYYQVFHVMGYRHILFAIAAVLILQGAIAIVLAASICRPFRYFWTQAVDVNDGSCGDVMLFYKSYSIPSLVTDLAMLVLPWPVLIRLRMPLSEKIGLVLTFMAASLGIITCALRFSVFFTTPLFSDPTWYASGGPTIYALVEPSIYMIASILPTTRHLCRRVMDRARQPSQQHQSRNWSVGGSGTGDGGSCNAKRGSVFSNSAAELDRMENGSVADGRQKRRSDDPWKVYTGSSQEELTMEEWHHRTYRQASSASTSEPAPSSTDGAAAVREE